jgi:uncharacterized protein YbjT (DUF2867 family)
MPVTAWRQRSAQFLGARAVILVTGASGFVGTHVVRRLAENGAGPIRAMVRNLSKAPTIDGVDVVEADLTRPQTLGPAVAGVKVIIHAAASRPTSRSRTRERTTR